MLGVGYPPVTGGLFLGSNAAGVLDASNRFPLTQDQRNSVRSRFRYQVAPRFWLALGCYYSSGVPVAFDGDYADAVAQNGQRIDTRVNPDRGNVRPSFSL